MTTPFLTWNEFLKDAENFLKISNKLNDEWTLFKKNDSEANTFLVYKKKLKTNLLKSEHTVNEDLEESQLNTEDHSIVFPKTNNEEIILIEYHIVYSISYQVPMLYFQIQRSDGSIVQLEEVWQIFGTNDEYIKSKTRAELLSILTQMEHPVLFRPYYAIHPCKTAELLDLTPASQNRILTFISLIGPYVQLNLNNAYGLEVC